MNISPYALILFCVSSLAAGQLSFKFVSLRLAEGHSLLSDPKTILVLGIALILYVSSTVVWIVALKAIPLSRAYLFMSLGYILVPLGASFLYGEALGVRYLVGLALIIAGIIVSMNN
jgi:drug/metabolite transporter (DMT)-like permease